MSKFKVGDKVRVKCDGGISTITYMAQMFSDSEIEYELDDDRTRVWIEEEFEPAEPDSAPGMTPKTARLKELTDKMLETYVAKNTAYGDSFSKSITKYGNIAALTRMYDKWNRIDTLMQGVNNAVQDEALVDTLQDMACYCLMTVIELEGCQ